MAQLFEMPSSGWPKMPKVKARHLESALMSSEKTFDEEASRHFVACFAMYFDADTGAQLLHRSKVSFLTCMKTVLEDGDGELFNFAAKVSSVFLMVPLLRDNEEVPRIAATETSFLAAAVRLHSRLLRQSDRRAASEVKYLAELQVAVIIHNPLGRNVLASVDSELVRFAGGDTRASQEASSVDESSAEQWVKRLDGSLVQVTREHFDTHPDLQAEAFLVTCLEGFDPQVGHLPDYETLRPRIATAFERLIRSTLDEEDPDLAALLFSLANIPNAPETVSYEELGGWQIDLSAAVYARRAGFSSSGRPDLDRDLAIIATTQFSGLEARSDYNAIAAGMAAAAARK